MFIDWTNKGFDVINIHGATMKFVIVAVGLMVCCRTYTFRYNKPRSQTKNTVSVAASSVGACTYLPLLSYIMLYYTHTVCTYYVCISVERTSLGTAKSVGRGTAL